VKLRDLDNYLVAEWRKAWRMLSVWAFVLLGAAPDLHAAIVAMGWLDDTDTPPAVKWSIRGLAVAGIALRLIRQQKPKP
jgi:hypothetical protein